MIRSWRIFVFTIDSSGGYRTIVCFLNKGVISTLIVVDSSYASLTQGCH